MCRRRRGGCELRGEGAKAGEEAVDPYATLPGREHLCGKGEGEECGEGARTHGGEVAEAAGERAVADGSGGWRSRRKVAAFEGEVGGDEELVAAGRAEDGAVVADAEDEVGRGAGGGECTSGADALDQGQFAQMFAHGEAKDTVVEGQTVAKSGAEYREKREWRRAILAEIVQLPGSLGCIPIALP